MGTRLDRRDFLSAIGAAGVASTRPHALFAAASESRKPRVATIITEYRGYSHADVIVGRLLQGHVLSTQETYWPRTQVVSMYVDQFPAADLSRGMAQQYNAIIAPSIEQALTLGTDELAVDGVVIVGEHGDYPHNKKGQHMYPRRRFFEETVNTFQKTGNTAPVFNDKHLGFAWQDAEWMFDKARQMRFPLMAGSSLPTAWRKPDLEYPLDVELEAGLAVGHGGIEAYGFHTLEMLQCMIERRRGGESGVTAVTCLEGDDIWRAAQRDQWPRDLLEAALQSLTNRPAGLPEDNCETPAVYLIEHSDGFRSTVVMLPGYVNTFCFAGKRAAQAEPDVTEFWLQEPEFGHFSYLTHNIETMILERREPYPPERTLLTTGILDAVMTSRYEGHRRVPTPWLSNVAYRTIDKPGRRAVGL